MKLPIYHPWQISSSTRQRFFSSASAGPFEETLRTLAAAPTIAAVLGWSAGAHQPSDKPVILRVSGMACGACAKTVEKEARKIGGVKAVKVSQPEGEAEITYDPAKTSPDAIAKKISDKTGFKAESSKKQ